MIGQAFLRGIATPVVGRVVALVTGEAISAQTVSRLTQVLDAQVCAFQEAQLADDWAYLLRDGVWMKVRRSLGPRRVLLLVAYGIGPDGERRLLAFARCFVEVRRRTRPMVVFTNVQSVDRIIYAIFNRFNQDWQTHTLDLFTQNA